MPTTPDDSTNSGPTIPDSAPETNVSGDTSVERTRAASTWTGLVIGTLVLILLLIFILQNLDNVTLQLFVWEYTLPLGINLLLAAIAGALIMALAGGVRIIQIRRAAKRRSWHPQG